MQTLLEYSGGYIPEISIDSPFLNVSLELSISLQTLFHSISCVRIFSPTTRTFRFNFTVKHLKNWPLLVSRKVLKNWLNENLYRLYKSLIHIWDHFNHLQLTITSYSFLYLYLISFYIFMLYRNFSILLLIFILICFAFNFYFLLHFLYILIFFFLFFLVLICKRNFTRSLMRKKLRVFCDRKIQKLKHVQINGREYYNWCVVERSGSTGWWFTRGDTRSSIVVSQSWYWSLFSVPEEFYKFHEFREVRVRMRLWSH